MVATLSAKGSPRVMMAADADADAELLMLMLLLVAPT